MQTTIIARIQTMSLLPELRMALQGMIQHDCGYFQSNRAWLKVISDLQQGFSIDQAAIEPFDLAWRVLYAAICRLDKIQDQDPIDDSVFAVLPSALQYNQVLAYYVLATHMLGDISHHGLSSTRLLRLQQAWTEAMLRMASGQQRDVAIAGKQITAASIEQYQEIAQYKTGATFALAFSGVAILNSDDPVLASKMAIIGETYGTLLQYSDDLLDGQTQPNQTMTLPQILMENLSQSVANHPDMGVAFYHYVLSLHMMQIMPLIDSLHTALRSAILAIFHETFQLQ
jgi:Polyprenyl synthetase